MSHSLLDDPLSPAWPFKGGICGSKSHVLARLNILFLQVLFMATDQKSTSSEENQTQFLRGTLLVDNIFQLNRRDREQIPVLAPNLKP